MSNYELVEDSAPWSLLYDDVLTQIAFRHSLQGKKNALCVDHVFSSISN